jgi:PAS domain S-box-containing protein
MPADESDNRAAFEDLFRIIAENGPDLIVRLGSDGAVRFVSGACRKIMGREPHELLGKAAKDFVHPDDLAASVVARAGGSSETEIRNLMRVRHKDGRWVWLEGNAHVVREPATGAVVEFVSLLRDVTEERTTAAALRLEQARLAEAQRIAQLGSFTWDPATNEMSWSDEMYVIFGVAKGVYRPTIDALRARVHPDDRARIRDAGENARRERRPWSVEYRILRADGAERTIQGRAAVAVDAEGRVSEVYGTAQDITERKEVDRLKNEFVSTVSHELRTPLTSIRGALGLIEGGAAGELPDAAQELVRIARRSTDRLVRLINDLLDIEKIDAGRVQLHRRRVLPSEIAQATMSDVAGVAQSACVSLQYDVLTDPPLSGDADRLVQALTNLVSNAIKFSSPGGGVVVTVRETAGRRARFEIVDRGPGISAADQPKLFAKFQRLDSSDTRSKDGTGLGLAIAKALVEEHGGEIGVVSAPGEGATFWFELPVVPDTSSRAGEDGRPRVLVVDDDADARAVISALLAPLGVECHEAVDGEHALELARALAPDLILLDVVMPGMGAFEVVEVLRHEDARGCPLVVYTAHELDAGEREQLRLGATRYLTKARTSEEDLIGAVKDLLRGASRRPG